MALLNGSFTGTMYYLNFDADGNMYMSSKEPKPGYVDKINPMTGVQNGYKKIIPYGISGYLNNVSIRPVKTNTGAEVPFLYLTFKDYENDEYYGFSFPVFQEGEKIHRYVKSFVKYYPNIDISRMLRFNSFKRKPEDEYAPSNLAIAYYNGETRAKKEDMIPMYYKKGQNGWPEAVKTVSKVSGKEMVSYEEQNAFVYKKLIEFANDFAQKIGPVREMLEKSYGVASGEQVQQPVEQYAAEAAQPAAQPVAPQQPAYQQPYQQAPQQQAPAAPQGQQYAPSAMPPRNANPVPTPPPAPPIYGEDDLPF